MENCKCSGILQPIDRGWAWIVAFAGMGIYWLLMGMIKVTGIILVEVESQFQASSLEIALIVGLRAIVSSLASLFSLGVLNDLFHLRIQIILGGIFVCSSYMTFFLAYSINLIYLHSILLGIGITCVLGPCLVIISQYFNKRLSIANAISSSGASVGTVTSAYLLKFLLDVYAFRGAMLIVGALSLNITALALLLRPPEFYNRFAFDDARSINVSENDVERTTNEGDEASTDEMKRNGVLRKESEKVSSSIADSNGPNVNNHNKNTCISESGGRQSEAYRHKNASGIERRDCDTFCDKNTKLLIADESLSTRSNPDLRFKPARTFLSPANRIRRNLSGRSESNYHASMISIYDCESISVPKRTDGVDVAGGATLNPERRYSLFVRPRDSSKKLQIFDVRVLKDAAFASFVLASSLYFAVITLHQPFLGPIAYESVRNLRDITIMISVFGASELLSRYAFGFLGDSGRVARYKILIFVIFLNGIMMNSVRYFVGFWPLLVYHCVGGCLHSCYAVITPGLIIDSFGRDMFARSWGIIILLRGFLYLALAQLVGYIRKISGSYAASFNLLGFTCILSACIFLFATFPLLRKRRRELSSKPDQ